jgi:uncharacterized protein (DUF1697 family)
MTMFIALLRAVNVGGTGKLSMKDLASICVDLGFENVRTYIQSGNVVLRSVLSEQTVKARLEQALTTRMGKRVDVLVRTASELRSVWEANPFPHAPPAKVGVVFSSRPITKALLENLVAPGGEQVRLGNREIYVYYPDGMGQSKLKFPPSCSPATIRNINTVAKLVRMTAAP